MFHILTGICLLRRFFRPDRFSNLSGWYDPSRMQQKICQHFADLWGFQFTFAYNTSGSVYLHPAKQVDDDIIVIRNIFRRPCLLRTVQHLLFAYTFDDHKRQHLQHTALIQMPRWISDNQKTRWKRLDRDSNNRVHMQPLVHFIFMRIGILYRFTVRHHQRTVFLHSRYPVVQKFRRFKFPKELVRPVIGVDVVPHIRRPQV